MLFAAVFSFAATNYSFMNMNIAYFIAAANATEGKEEASTDDEVVEEEPVAEEQFF
jgi:hypothetical protein